MIKLKKEALMYIDKHQLIQSDDRILVGCSGGIDSIVLLHFLSEFCQRKNIDLAAVHVNHMLRGKEADQDRFFVERFCEERQIPVYCADIPIPEILRKESGNMQDVCRRERYAYFSQVMEEQGYNKLAVAHHADDQMETILMALIKGAHEQGILGMPAKREFASFEIIRPLLSVTRENIEQYLAHYRLQFREDESNNKDSYFRNRIRHHMSPLLKDENVQVTKAFQHFSEKQRMEDAYLEQQATAVLRECIISKEEKVVKISIDAFQTQPLALQRRAILLLLKYLYKDTIIAQSYALWTAILELVKTTNGNAEITLPDGGLARRNYGLLTLYRYAEKEIVQPQKILLENDWHSLHNGYRIGVFSPQQNMEIAATAEIFTLTRAQLPVVIRPREPGDRMQLAGMTGSKKVSRILIDAKIPKQTRDIWPVLVDANNTILAIPGIRTALSLHQTKSLIDGVALIIDTEK